MKCETIFLVPVTEFLVLTNFFFFSGRSWRNLCECWLYSKETYAPSFITRYDTMCNNELRTEVIIKTGMWNKTLADC